MPTITFHLSEQDRAAVLQAAEAAGINVSEYIRRALDLRQQHPRLADTLADHEHRIGNLERETWSDA